MESNYQIKFQNLKSRLEKNPNITTSIFNLNLPANDETVKHISDEFFGGLIPEEIESFYKTFNGCSIEWFGPGKPPDQPAGFFEIFPIEIAFGGFEKNLVKKNEDRIFQNTLWTNDYSSKEKKELKKHKVLESILGVSDYVTLKIIENKYQLYYVRRGDVFLIKMTFSEYINNCINLLGMYGIRKEFINHCTLEELSKTEIYIRTMRAIEDSMAQ